MDLAHICPNTLKDVDDCIESGLYKIFFASKFVNIDEFTKQKYKGNNIMKCIPGYEAVTQMPRGYISYNNSNEWLFKLACMKFILQYNIIPISYTNLNSIMNIKRSTGKIQRAHFSKNNCIRMSKSYNKLVANCSFNENDDVDNKNNEPTIFSNKTKSVLIGDLIKLNNIDKLIINYKIYSDEYISTLNELQQECFNHYNKLIHDWFKTFEENLDEDIKIIINVDHFNI